MTRILEICIDSPAGLAAALDGGADRIELCAALALGGLTPSQGLIELAARTPVPVLAMIRPRAGGFDWSAEEVGAMEAEIATVLRAGLAGVVIGATRTTAQGVSLDLPVMQRLVTAAKGHDITLHRCIDLMEDPFEAIDQAAALGISRILSSGGAASASAGTDRLRQMMAHAGDRIRIMPGAGVSSASLPDLLDALDPREVHASGSQPDPAAPKLARFGFQPEGARRTDAATVADLRRLLERQDARR
ncbi:copper homeostasis protein CutC [Salipiger mangrovisoli]|uniref:PF03932 family protein CutC n=1 Tax=Salipiger mangrovisoli TaxID=2865933 RepID=A0ABR9X1A7_9RHOB|nr:copper homeostasis protein CutC [Salipiger mangrovisoli]MBE9637345.1 copper homeostasis protein CutC [Salipiger mangrovisoli]